MKNLQITIACIFLVSGLTTCTMMYSPLSLELPAKATPVLQQIPANDRARAKSPLYLPPRRIEEKEFGTPALEHLLDTMYAVMQRTAGVGIAANQIGKQLQIFIIEAKADNPRYKVLGPVAKQLFINPRITKVSAERRNFWHGCLSAAGAKRGNVATYEWIEYECRDENGSTRQARLDGFAAVIFQHEFRHLMNGTYLDVATTFMDKPELDRQIGLGKVPFFEPVNDSLPLLIQGYTIGDSIDACHAKNKAAVQR